MAQDTPISYRSLVIYQVYVRNHTPGGTFAELETDLARIRSIGADILYLMPIHPIGKVNHKGTLGSPYSISDYRGINPAYGTLDDFSRLVDRAHALGMRVMIDVVYNHTAPDSLLIEQHPEWYTQDANGRPITTVPEWTDVIDLKHPNPALWDYLIETLIYWVQQGVDGFRCDVASLLPEAFWLKARQAVQQVKPGVIWLAESVHAGWIAARRSGGLFAISDSEVYRGFDLAYPYDVWPIFTLAVEGKVPLTRYLEMLRLQDGIYPLNFVKARCVENHDQPRIMRLAPSRNRALAWTAFEAFNKGAFFIYAGQESGADHTPSLFDIDKLVWGDYPLQPFITRLAELKNDPAMLDGVFTILSGSRAIQACWQNGVSSLYGVFNTQGESGALPVQLADGDYANLLDGTTLSVRDGSLELPGVAAVVRFPAGAQLKPFYSELLDYYRPPE